MIEGPKGIREAYQDATIAHEYVQHRFREPLGAMLHVRQVSRVRSIARALRPLRVLEIAPGPARLTVDVASTFPRGATLIDASGAMLGEARTRLREAGHRTVHLVQADAFNLPFAPPFDLVYSFRLIRHFEEADRARLYREVARILRPGGLLVFDAVNEAVSRPFRDRAGNGHQHFDALLTAERISEELGASGFDVARLDGVQHRFPLLYRLQVLVAPRSRPLARACMELVDRLPGGQPLEWVVTCRRRWM
jgi:SAM-dependent methyltransferase